MSGHQEAEKRRLGEAAAERVADETVLGLGTGSTVSHFAAALGRRIRNGLRVRAIPTSAQSETLARKHGIPLIDWQDVRMIDLCVDGADEVSASLDMIKGGGGALLWEKIVASLSRRRIYIADSSKLRPYLGTFPLPVEVVRFGSEHISARIRDTGARVERRDSPEGPFITSSGNLIFDCHYERIDAPEAIHGELKAIPGIIETGLFIDMIDELLTLRDGAVVSVSTPEEAFWAG